MITTKYRELRSQYERIYATLRNQSSRPSRGFNEESHIRKMNEVYEQMEAELDRIDGVDPRKDLIRQIIAVYHKTRMAGQSAEDFILSHEGVQEAFRRL